MRQSTSKYFPTTVNGLLIVATLLFCTGALFGQRARTHHRTRKHSSSAVFTTTAGYV